ncbi:MAG: AIM24 family protein [Clostridiales bacterium]|nr:AIM24 family protein [Clostridiales bacterium]
MFTANILSQTASHHVVEQHGCFNTVEYTQDYSVTHDTATSKYFAAQMNLRKRQVVAALNGNAVTLQAGAMQMLIGQVDAATNVKGAGDLVKKFIGSKVTGESAIKPAYTGHGLVVLEPTYKYILYENVENWNGGMVIDDGLFLACDSTVELGVVARSNLSSAILGNEGLFNSILKGNGIAVLESRVPAEELFVVDLNNDVLKIDGNMAIAWSGALEFTVERTTKTLVGSAASGEGLVNVYRGTGRVLMSPVG